MTDVPDFLVPQPIVELRGIDPKPQREPVRNVGRDEKGNLIIPDDDYVRPLPRGGYALSGLAAADIAVASGWIEDTPEARAAYLAGDEEP